MRIKSILAVAATLVAGAGQAATIVNGSFEDGVAIPDGSFVTLAAGDSTSITGWTVLRDGVDYIGGYWEASDGDRSVDLSALDAGQLSQTTIQDLIAGMAYRVSFDMSGNPDGGVGTARLVASVTGGEAQVYTYEVTAANSRANMRWQTMTYDFVASSSIQDIQFLSLEMNPFGPALDNVRIEQLGVEGAVPEPGTWVLMIAGFGFVGFAARRRSATRSIAA